MDKFDQFIYKSAATAVLFSWCWLVFGIIIEPNTPSDIRIAGGLYVTGTMIIFYYDSVKGKTDKDDHDIWKF